MRKKESNSKPEEIVRPIPPPSPPPGRSFREGELPDPSPRNWKDAIGTSSTKEQVRECIRTFRHEIDTYDSDIPLITHTVNWGTSKRGQGKRSNDCIKGGMSAAPHGERQYAGIDLTKYKNDHGGIWNLRMTVHQAFRYYIAREYGCNELEAAVKMC